MLNLKGTYTLTPLGINLTREVFESTLEAALSSDDVSKLKSTQDIDKYAYFIINAISTAVDKAIPPSKAGALRVNLFRKNCLR